MVGHGTYFNCSKSGPDLNHHTLRRGIYYTQICFIILFTILQAFDQRPRSEWFLLYTRRCFLIIIFDYIKLIYVGRDMSKVTIAGKCTIQFLNNLYAHSEYITFKTFFLFNYSCHDNTCTAEYPSYFIIDIENNKVA